MSILPFFPAYFNGLKMKERINVNLHRARIYKTEQKILTNEKGENKQTKKWDGMLFLYILFICFVNTISGGPFYERSSSITHVVCPSWK